MLTTACEGLVMLNYASNKSTVSFSEKCKDLFTEASYIKGIVVRTKLKKGEYNQKYKNIHYIFQKIKDINHTELKLNGTIVFSKDDYLIKKENPIVV